MAMTISSCSKHSPNISILFSSSHSHPKISSIATTPIQYPPPNHTHNYPPQESAYVIPGGVDLSAATTAPAPLKRDKVSSAAATACKRDKVVLDRVKGSHEGSEVVKCELGQHDEEGVKLRRKRRRKKRRATEECVGSDGEEEDDKLLSVDENDGKSRFMTPKEEATFSWYLKERARVEAVRRELVESNRGHELSLSQWAKAANITRHNLNKILCNGEKSADRITRSYKRLVVSIALSYVGRGLSLQDLTQEGYLGLLRGAIKFNPKRGYKLSTYAYWWIRQSITRAIANRSRIIRLPGSISELVPKICKAKAILSERLQRSPTYAEIAEAIDVKPKAVRLAIVRSRPPISLHRQIITSQGRCLSLQDIIPGPDELTPEAMVKKAMVAGEIRRVLKCLREREAQVLRLRYGLDGYAPWSFDDIGRLLNLSRETARHISKAALSKLRSSAGIDDLKYFIR